MALKKSSPPANRSKTLWRLLGYALALLTYVVLLVPQIARHQNRIHADLIAYVRRATYLWQGDFYHFISGYWSPLICLSIAPLAEAFKMDGIHAAHIAIGIWGALLVVAFGLFLDTFTTLPRLWKLGAMIVVAAATSAVGSRNVTPDPILAAMLLLYFAAKFHPRLQRPGGYFLMGILGGFAYLAKAYGFPFVIVHLPASCLMLAKLAPTDAAAAGGWLGRGLKMAAIAMAGFALIAGPWVAIISWRYGHFTFSTTGTIAHAIVGPPGESRRIFPPYVVPEDPYLIAWENPELIEHHRWSPLASRQNFVRQLEIIWFNAKSIGLVLRGFDLIWLTPVFLSVAVLAAVSGKLLKGERWKIAWLLLTILLYCGGFLPVYFIPRYIHWLVMPLCLALGLMLIQQLRLGGLESKARLVRSAACILLGVSAMIVIAGNFVKDMAARDSLVFRNIANDFRKFGLKGPIAGNDRVKGFNVAYYAGEKYVALPLSGDALEADRRLADAGVGIMLIWKEPTPTVDVAERPNIAADIRRLPRWKRITLPQAPSTEILVPADSANADAAEKAASAATKPARKVPSAGKAKPRKHRGN
jgi:hypothetical protein